MNLKKIQKILIAAIMALGLISGSAAVATADTTGGGTGGGGSTGQQNGFYWASVSSAGGVSAYTKFIQTNGWSQWFAESQVQQRVGNLGVCQNSDVIWFLMGPQVWAYNFQGYPSWYSSPVIAGTIENPRSLWGPGPTAAQYQHFISWDDGIGGHRRWNSGAWNSPVYTIVCSYATWRDPISRTESSSSIRSSSQTETFTKPYSWSTEVKRQELAGDGGKDPIGADNLHDQAESQKSAFGAFWDKVNSSPPMSPTALKNGVNTAIAQDASSNHAVVDLDAQNKAGMAEGGILNFNENTQYATVSATEVTNITTVTNCTYVRNWNSGAGAYNPETKSCSSYDQAPQVIRTSSATKGTLENTGFWQMLSVHCNLDEFKALLASDSSLKEIQTPNISNKMSGVVVTKKYDSQPASARSLDFAPTAVPMKGVAMPDPAKVRTGQIGFYDKECPFDCTNSKATADGASANNGATTNVGAPGAVSNKVNSNSFEFFRDNAPKDIAVDTWYPISNNGVSYKGDAPLTTTVTRDVNGTPSLDGSGGGKFAMKSSKDGTTLFTGTATAVNTQKNWDTSKFSGPMATILNGLHNKFTVQSTWASDAGKPQAFNFKWEYAPNVSSGIPLTGVGFGPNSTQQTGKIGLVSGPIQGKCYTYFGTPANPDMTALFGSNTGTGTENNIDGHLLADSAAKLTTNFVRSTTE